MRNKHSGMKTFLLKMNVIDVDSISRKIMYVQKGHTLSKYWLYVSVNQQACLKCNCNRTCSSFHFSVFSLFFDFATFLNVRQKKLMEIWKGHVRHIRNIYVWIFLWCVKPVKISLYMIYIFRVNGMNEMHTESIDLLYFRPSFYVLYDIL